MVKEPQQIIVCTILRRIPNTQKVPGVYGPIRVFILNTLPNSIQIIRVYIIFREDKEGTTDFLDLKKEQTYKYLCNTMSRYKV